MHLSCLIAALFAALTTSAYAQVRQSGTITPHHSACWVTTGVIGDCGATSNPYTTSFAVSPGPLCVNSGPTSAPYNQLCLISNASADAIISLQSLGGATSRNLEFNINGSVSTAPFQSYSQNLQNISGFSTADRLYGANASGVAAQIICGSGITCNGTSISFGGAVTQGEQTCFKDSDNPLIACKAYLYAVSYGVTCDGSDQTTEINTAFAAAYAAQRGLEFPAGVCRFRESSPGSGCAFLNEGVSWRGQGGSGIVFTAFQPLSSMVNTADIFCFRPPTSSDQSFVRIQDFQIIARDVGGTARGRRGIYFLWNQASQNVAQMKITGVNIGPFDTNNLAMEFVTDTALNAQGIPSNSQFVGNAFYGGVKAVGLGDSVNFGNNIFRSTAARACLDITQVGDVSNHASLLIIDNNNNMDCAGGAISKKGGGNTKIFNNNIEQSAGAGTAEGAVISIVPAYNDQNDEIRGNHLGIFGSATVSYGIYLDKSERTTIDDNWFSTALGTTNALKITANASNVVIGYNNYLNGFSANISNAGPSTWYSTVYTVNTFTPTLTAGNAQPLTSAVATGEYSLVSSVLASLFQFSITAVITTNGAAATSLLASIPFTMSAACAGGGQNSTTGTAVSWNAATSGSSVRILKYDGNYPGADATTITISGECRGSF